MGYRRKAEAWLLAAGIYSLLAAGTAFGAEREPVGKLYLTIDADVGISDGEGTVSVTPTGKSAGLYTVEETEIINDSGEGFRNSDPPQVEIAFSVKDEDGFYFSETSSRGFKLTLAETSKSRYDAVEFVKAERREDKTELLLTVRLVFDEEADTGGVSKPGTAEWSETEPGTACWSPAAKAKYYQVELIKNGAETGEIRSIYGERYDFASQIEGPGEYQFQVRSVKEKTNVKSGWTVSGVMTVSDDGAYKVNGGFESSAGWQRAADGVRYWWKNADGTFPAAEWRKIDGSWYYFDGDGYMATGWVLLGESWYFLDRDTGALWVSGRTPDGYLVDEEGRWVREENDS